MDLRPDPVVVIPTIYANPLLLAKCREAIGPDVPVVIAHDPVSFAENCNTGAARSTGDVIVFLNDDTEPQPGWLDAILTEFEDPRVAIVGCRLKYPDGRIQHAGVGFRRVNGTLEAYNELRFLPTRDVDAVTGACLAIRREVFEAMGGFDEGFVNGYEDVDLCLRVRAEGWRIRYTADAAVVHHESQSGPARWAHVRENIARLQEKHGDHQLV